MTHKLPQTGISDKAAVAKLRRSVVRPRGKNGVSMPAPAETMPPWLAEMTRRMGLHEVRNNYTLMEWLRSGAFLGDPSKLPWCGDAIETCIVRTLNEPVPNNPFWAQAWRNFGIDACGPKVGAIGVIKWSARAGHVGIVVDYDARRKRVKLRGGNQGNMIKDAWFPLRKFIAFRWPKTFPIKKYPPVGGHAAVSGGKAGTR